MNEPFNFTPPWYALGIVDDAVLAKLWTEWDKGEDPNAEHYRNWTFKEYFQKRQPVAAELAIALWEMAETDPDLRWVIRTEIVRRPECPQVLLDAALASGQKHLARIIERRNSRVVQNQLGDYGVENGPCPHHAKGVVAITGNDAFCMISSEPAVTETVRA